jgi:hypothetical protein
MNTHTHTPGPWRKSKISPHIYGPENEYLAICENPLNARLISAAPDMLAACKKARGTLISAKRLLNSCGAALGMGQAFAMLESAIAKAEGGNA